MTSSQPEDSLSVRWMRTTFNVPKMDCPSEERMIRLAMADLDGVDSLEFDLPGRSLVVVHSSAVEEISRRLAPLGLGARPEESVEFDTPPESVAPTNQHSQETRTLWILLAINGVMFVAEMVAGWLAQSTGLMADALDMLADAAVYGISLYAVGRAARLQLRAAHLSGWLQMALALGALAEVIRRFVMGSEPEPVWMMGVSTVALVANVSCLYLISRHRQGGAHMKASWIFSTNDVVANLGVVGAGLLVSLTQSRFPDLLIGAIIATIVLTGSVRILRLR